MAKQPEHTIVKRKDGRFAVRKRGGGYINKDEKVKILVEAGKIKAPLVKKEAPAEEKVEATEEAAPTEA